MSALVLWALPVGDVRGATFFLLLVMTLAFGAWRRWQVNQHSPQAEHWVALTLGTQALFHSESYLLTGGLADFLLAELAVPIVAGLAFFKLQHRIGPPLWLAFLTLVSIGRGISPEAALGVVVVAAVLMVVSRERLAFLWLLPAAFPVVAIDWNPPMLVATALGFVAFGLLLAEVRLSPLFGLLAAALFLLWRPEAGPRGLALLPAVFLLLPSIIRTPQRRIPTLGTALLLLVATGSLVSGRGAWAPGVLLIAAALPKTGQRFEVQRLWTALLALGATLVAGYPWIREAPLETVLPALGLGSWSSVVVVVVLYWMLTTITPARLASQAIPTATLIALLWQSHPGPQTLLEGPVVLTEASSSQRLSHTKPISRVSLDTYVSNSQALAPGTEVARLTILSDGGNESFGIRLGHETGEWASLRPNLSVEARPPPAHISWLAPDGPYLARRYRATLEVDSRQPVSELVLERDARLDPTVTFSVFQVGVRP